MAEEETPSIDLHTFLVSLLTALMVVCAAGTIFMWAFQTKSYSGVCERHGWRLEGTGPYQHKHCYDPASRQMYLPAEIDP